MYVEFYTDHLTFFTVGVSSGDFVIENDAPVVYDRNVTLGINATPALDEMRFAELSVSPLSSASFVPYQPTYPFTLSIGDGPKTVL